MLNKDKKIALLERTVKSLEDKNKAALTENEKLKNQIDEYKKAFDYAESFQDKLKEVKDLKEKYLELITECSLERQKYKTMVEELIKSAKE